MFWEPAQAFLQYAIALILAGSAAVLIAIFAFLPDQTLRALGPVTMSAVTLIAWYLLSRGMMAASVYVLAFGYWAVASAIGFFYGGMANMAILFYPQMILLLGWLAGTRAAVAMALLSMATTLGFALAESWGVLPLPPPTPPAMRWVNQSVLYVLSVILIVYFVRAYQSRLNELNALDSDLNRAQAVAHVGSWVFDLATDSLRLSAETCRIFGVPEGTTGSHRSYLARVHPDDRARVDGAWQAALKGGEAFDNEHRILVGDALRWVRQRAEIEFRGDGTPLRSVGTTQDITERKQAELQILAARSQLNATLDAIPDLLFEVGPDGRFHDFHSPRSELLAAPPADFLGKKICDVLPPGAAEVAMAALREAQDSGRSHGKQYELELSQGKFWFELSVSRKAVAPGQEPRFIALSRDITERKLAENELLQQKNLLNTIIESASEAIFAKDTAGQYRSINGAGARMLGYGAIDVIGRTDLELLPAATANEFRKTDAYVISSGQAYEREESGVIGGKTCIFRTHKTPWRDNSGKIVGVIGMSTDITERKRAEAAHAELEAQLRESQKMEALGTLAGGVAHDFNNIVAAILGNVELARQDVGAEHPALESLEEIRKASRRAKDLVQQILAFGRRQVMKRDVISLAPVVHESARLLRSTLPAGVSLEVECAPDAPQVLADATQIEQVLLNLCSNAWQAMQAQARPGAIEIRLAAHVVDGAQYRGPERRTRGERISLRAGRYACLTVRDHGPGMNQATRSHIFEPFFTTKPAGVGTGLGLSVVHGIVREHDASIVVQSAPGEGATFRIYFPAAQRPGAPAPRSGAAGANGVQALVLQAGGKHILYLDDDEAIVFLMTRLLEREGYRVSGHTDAREALAAVRAKPGEFDLVVTDYNMPGMSGLEVAQALQRIRPDLPVALASGYITEELRAKAPAAGVRELIYKPDTAEDFCQSVARLVNAIPA